MGNKISLGKCVIYCGFPGQRKKTKQKEVEQRRKEEELERYEIWLRAEKFKADFPEYCIKAGIAPSSLVPSAHHSEQTSEESRRTKVRTIRWLFEST
jgi:DNA-binding protein H-NS